MALKADSRMAVMGLFVLEMSSIAADIVNMWMQKIRENTNDSSAGCEAAAGI